MRLRLSLHYGFTLIEILIVLGIFSFVSLALFRSVWEIVQLSNRAQQWQVTSLELAQAGQRIEYFIRNADSVEDIGDHTLTLGVSGSSETIMFFLENGVLMMERNHEQFALTSSRVIIDQLTFTQAKASDKVARFVGFEISGHTSTLWEDPPLSLRGGSMVESLINE